MIEQLPRTPESAETRLVLRPNRSLTARQLGAWYGVLALASASVAGFSFAQGNVFAPLFAVIELSLLALCLVLVWRVGNRCEVIAVGPAEVAVRRLPELDEARFGPPHWVRLDVAGQSGPPKLWLASGSRRVEVGSDLGEEERRRLAGQLRALLDDARS